MQHLAASIILAVTPCVDPDPLVQVARAVSEAERAAFQDAADYAQSIGSDCLVIMRDGEVQFEWYNEAKQVDANSLVDSWSVAKSFTSVLVGIAIEQGLITSADQPASDFIHEWRDDTRRDITIGQLLSGTSGLDTDKYPEDVWGITYLWNIATDYQWSVNPFVRDHTQYAIESELTYDPGTQWKYNNRAIQSLEAVLERATGMHVEDFARDHLWEPIGMDPRTNWRKDKKDNPWMYSSVNATCRDQALFGELIRNNGQWGGRQLIDREYLRDMTTPSTRLNPAYGYLWWLNQQVSEYRGNNNKRYTGRPFPTMPTDMVSAQGVGQNFIDVIASTGMVIVHSRRAPNERFDEVLAPLGMPHGAGLPFAARRLKRLLDETLNDADQTEHREILERISGVTDRP